MCLIFLMQLWQKCNKNVQRPKRRMLRGTDHVQRVRFNRMEVAQFIFENMSQKCYSNETGFSFFFSPPNSLQHYIQCKL